MRRIAAVDVASVDKLREDEIKWKILISSCFEFHSLNAIVIDDVSGIAIVNIPLLLLDISQHRFSSVVSIAL